MPQKKFFQPSKHFSLISKSLTSDYLLWQLAAISLMALCLLISLPSSALAYQLEKRNEPVTGQFTMSPTSIDVDMSAGEIAIKEVVIVNRTGSPINVEISTEDFKGSDDPDQSSVLLGDQSSSLGAKDWLQPELNKITLNQGETLTFNVKITVPEMAEPGGHYGTILASYNSIAQNEQGAAVKVTSRLGCFFLIRIAGNIVEDGTLEKPEVSRFFEYGPIDIGLIFHNSGNVHERPGGKVLITNLLGQTVAELPVTQWTVLPDAARRTEVEWNRHYLFGRYTARVEIGYGTDGKTLETETTFWVIPWKITLIAVAILALIVTAFVKLRTLRRS